MVYDKSRSPKLDPELFRNPTCEYRGAPFWAWNGTLKQEQIAEQIGYFKEMGLGGFHMHVRTGLATPYLSDEYMDDIRFCVETARKEQMLAWAYDEDRWPSGAAGGLVTKDPQYRARYLLFTSQPYSEDGSGKTRVVDSSGKMGRSENGTLLACYDVTLNEDGSLRQYAVAAADASPAPGATRWYAYLETAEESSWYNGQTYVNTLDKRSMDRFVEVTHQRYADSVGDAFGDVIPAFFTDEPQFTRKQVLSTARSQGSLTVPWTDDFADTFQKAYGVDILAHLPQLFWEQPENGVSRIRYWYHDHVTERFAVAFADNVGGWCKEHGVHLTGHMMEEPTLESQTASIGEAMRSYRSMTLPGIDMLCDVVELTTAKQTQSAVHQFGYEGMVSELYGVTGWDFDFRGHKWQGDWQAALGVTLRVPHLAWMSMAGEAKRDYPASIFYQSPWYKEYARIEDHFARVNTALTRGKAVVRVGVIHPVESYWLHWGPNEETGLIRDQLEQQFEQTIQWLLFGGVDFDYICESLLPRQCEAGSAPLKVGEMAYDAVVMSGCETLRGSTLERLEAFVQAGGTLIVMGDAPRYIDVQESDRGRALAEKAVCISQSRAALLSALAPFRTVQMHGSNGNMTDNLIYQMRQDGDERWLFVAHARRGYNKDLASCDTVRFTLDGCWKPTLYDTVTGEIQPLSFETTDSKTVFSRVVYDYDSLLLRLTPAEAFASGTADGHAAAKTHAVPVPERVPVTLSEPNALLLDAAEYALDGGAWQPRTEIMRLDNICRAILGWPSRDGNVVQPWVLGKEVLTHTLSLRFAFDSDCDVDGVQLAVEDAEHVTVTLDGKQALPDGGWYVDKAIQTMALPPIQAGHHVLEVTMPFGKTTHTEWCYLIGDFGVAVCGETARITAPVRTLAFGDVTHQGLPFYGGNITYHIPFETEKAGTVTAQATFYRGAMLRMTVEEASHPVIYPPYAAAFEVQPGTHTLDLTLYGNRQNSFGPVHLCDEKHRWHGPGAWRSTGDSWSDAYCLKPLGVLKKPEITAE